MLRLRLELSSDDERQVLGSSTSDMRALSSSAVLEQSSGGITVNGGSKGDRRLVQAAWKKVKRRLGACHRNATKIAEAPDLGTIKEFNEYYQDHYAPLSPDDPYVKVSHEHRTLTADDFARGAAWFERLEKFFDSHDCVVDVVPGYPGLGFAGDLGDSRIELSMNDEIKKRHLELLLVHEFIHETAGLPGHDDWERHGKPYLMMHFYNFLTK